MQAGEQQAGPVQGLERIGPYRLVRRLGQGGMGEVFLAWDDRLGRRVAIKRIRRDRPNPRDRERLRREAAARLSHPAVVQVYDLVESEDGDAIVLEYAEGRTLRELLAKGPMAPATAVRLAREVAEGLAAAHAAGLIHRDLKAESVMVTPDGRAKILDFGVAKDITWTTTKAQVPGAWLHLSAAHVPGKAPRRVLSAIRFPGEAPRRQLSAIRFPEEA